jgi:hypothetical protein
LLERVTTAPPDGADPFRYTVPVDGVPPATDDGLSESDARSGVTVRFALSESELYEAVTCTLVFVLTAAVFSVTVSEVLPAGTVVLPETVTAPLFAETVTGSPPVGAGAFNMIVPVTLFPPTTVVGERLNELIQGFTVRYCD